MSLFDSKPIKRVEIGPASQPTKTREERYAQERADRDMTAMRLKAAEALWRTVVEAAGGGLPPSPEPAKAESPAPVSSSPYAWSPDDELF